MAIQQSHGQYRDGPGRHLCPTARRGKVTDRGCQPHPDAPHAAHGPAAPVLRPLSRPQPTRCSSFAPTRLVRLVLCQPARPIHPSATVYAGWRCPGTHCFFPPPSVAAKCSTRVFCHDIDGARTWKDAVCALVQRLVALDRDTVPASFLSALAAMDPAELTPDNMAKKALFAGPLTEFILALRDHVEARQKAAATI